MTKQQLLARADEWFKSGTTDPTTFVLIRDLRNYVQNQPENEHSSEPMCKPDTWQEKYEKLKEFVKGKWKGDCTECAAIANTILNKEGDNEK